MIPAKRLLEDKKRRRKGLTYVGLFCGRGHIRPRPMRAACSLEKGCCCHGMSRLGRTGGTAIDQKGVHSGGKEERDG